MFICSFVFTVALDKGVMPKYWILKKPQFLLISICLLLLIRLQLVSSYAAEPSISVSSSAAKENTKDLTNYVLLRLSIHRDLKMENILLDTPKKNVKLVGKSSLRVCAVSCMLLRILLLLFCHPPTHPTPE